MNTVNNIAKKCAALLFLGLLLFPVFVQSLHGFANHEHEVCNDLSTHMHNVTTDCDLDDVRLPVFTEITFIKAPEPIIIEHKRTPTLWADATLVFSISTIKGRAPPIG